MPDALAPERFLYLVNNGLVFHRALGLSVVCMVTCLSRPS
jgi:hypothetical protein